MRPPPVSKNDQREVLHGSLTVRYKLEESNKETAPLTESQCSVKYSSRKVLPPDRGGLRLFPMILQQKAAERPKRAHNV